MPYWITGALWLQPFPHETAYSECTGAKTFAVVRCPYTPPHLQLLYLDIGVQPASNCWILSTYRPIVHEFV